MMSQAKITAILFLAWQAISTPKEFQVAQLGSTVIVMSKCQSYRSIVGLSKDCSKCLNWQGGSWSYSNTMVHLHILPLIFKKSIDTMFFIDYKRKNRLKL